MRNIIVFNLITIDGYFAGPNGELDWHNYDEEVGAFSIEQMKTLGGLIFGRTTYELMAGYWPTDEGMKSEPVVAEIMNAIPKTVFSTTLSDIPDAPHWKNVTVRQSIDPEQIQAMKAQAGKDLAIFGSGTIVQQLTNLGLIDEYRIMVNPVILGKGKLLFAGVDQKHRLQRIRTREFSNGNVLIYYSPVAKKSL
jgi:dihydrofolate reductase